MKDVSLSSVSAANLFKSKLPLISRYSPTSNKLLYVNVANNKYSNCESMRNLNKKLNTINTQYDKFKQENNTINANNKQFSKMYRLFYLPTDHSQSHRNIITENSNSNTNDRNQYNTIQTDSSYSTSWKQLNKTQKTIMNNQPNNIFDHSLILLPNNKLQYLNETQSTNATFRSEGNFLSKCALRLKRKDLSTLQSDDKAKTNGTINTTSTIQTIYSLNALKIKENNKRHSTRNQFKDLNGVLRNSFVSVFSKKKDEDENDVIEVKKKDLTEDNSRIVRPTRKRPMIDEKQKREELTKVYDKVIRHQKIEVIKSNSFLNINRHKDLIRNYFKKYWTGNRITNVLKISEEKSSNIHKGIELSKIKTEKMNINKVIDGHEYKHGMLSISKKNITTLNILDSQISNLERDSINNLLK